VLLLQRAVPCAMQTEAGAVRPALFLRPVTLQRQNCATGKSS